MQNVVFSKNVKQYLIHALKGIGLRGTQPQAGAYPEMSEADILKLLDHPQTTFNDIYNRIKLAVAHQLQNDAKTSKYVQSNTAFDRQTIKSVLGNIPINNKKFPFRDQAGDSYLRDLTGTGIDNDGNINTLNSFQLDETAEAVIVTVLAGMPEKDLEDNEKDEAAWFWNEVQYAGYKKWLINEKHSYQPHLPFNQQKPSFEVYHREKLRAELFDRTMACCNNDAKVTQGILDYKITEPEMIHKFSADEQLWQRSRKLCTTRGKNPDTDLTIADVLLVMSDESSKSRLTTFFQTRSREQQDQQKANPKMSGVHRQVKVGNVIGEAGRKLVKAKTGRGVVVDFDKVGGMRKAKQGPWRGYKELYDKILSFLTDLYRSVPAIGFVQRILERDGVIFSSGNSKEIISSEDLTKAWKTDYKAMTDAYKENPQQGQTTKSTLNVAGEFYNKTKARLLADKMRLSSKQAQIADDYAQNHTDLSQLNEQVAYLQQRINTAEQILHQQMPNPNSPTFNDPNYFAMLESQIMAEDANQENEGARRFLENTKHHDANQEMIDALDEFKRAANGTTSNQQAAKREMAVEMFHLQSKVENNEINDQDLDGMTDRFVKSGLLSQMCWELNRLSPIGEQKSLANAKADGPEPKIVPFDSRDYMITAVDTNAAINQFVEKDLQQNAAKDNYNAYMADQARSKILDAVIAER